MRSWLYAAVGWTLMIAALCWTPGEVVQRVGDESNFFRLPNFDKLVHTGLFMGFAFFWLKASHPPKRFMPVMIGGLAWTAITELGQLSSYVNRDARLDDAAFDMLGVLLGGLAYYWLESRQERTRATTAIEAEAA